MLSVRYLICRGWTLVAKTTSERYLLFKRGDERLAFAEEGQRIIHQYSVKVRYNPSFWTGN
jgi:hypothetical protein